MRATRNKPLNNSVVSIGEVEDGELDMNKTGMVSLPFSVDDDLETDEQEEKLQNNIDKAMISIGLAPSDAAMTIYRVNTVSKEESYCFDTTPAEFSLSYISLEYGPGHYRIRGWKQNLETNRPIIFVNRIVKVEPQPEAVRKAHQEKIESEKKPQTGIAPEIQQLFTGMQTAMLAMAEAVKEMKPKESSRKEMFEEMLLMQKILAPTSEKKEDPLDALDKMLSIKGKLDALGGGSESSFMPLLAEMAKPMIEAAKNQMSQKQLPTPPAAEELPPEENPSPEPNMGENMNMMMQMVLNAARINADTETYANLILDHMPEAMLDSFMTDPQWYEKLCHAIPDAKNYEPWFRDVKQHMVDLLTDDNESGTSTGNQPIGDNANAKT